MIKSINAMGLQCPLPVIQAKKAISELRNATLEVTVDNVIAAENLLEMAEQLKLKAVKHKIYDYFVVSIEVSHEEGYVEEKNDNVNDCRQMGTIVVISSDHMGKGDEELGRVLIKGFIYALCQMERVPETIIFYNSGVTLTTRNSDSLDDLKLLESQGTELLSCGTCLNHYGLMEDLLVGTVTDMYTVVEKISAAIKIIKP